MKLAFVTDSGTGFSQEFWKEKGIYSLPLQIEVEGKTYEDYESFHPADVVKEAEQHNVMRTSLPKLGQIEDLFEQLKEDGYEGVFCVPICKGLSGTLDAMEMAASHADLKFYGYDCYTTAVVQAWCIETAKAMYEEGKDIPEIIEYLEKSCKDADTILLCDDLQHMKRGGRLTPAAALLGGLLKIKPVLHDNYETDGKVDVLAKVRTMSKAQDYVIQRLKDRGVKAGWDLTVAHVGALEPAKAYLDRIQSAIPGLHTRIIDLVSAVGVHTGPGCLAVQVFDPQGKEYQYDIVD